MSVSRCGLGDLRGIFCAAFGAVGAQAYDVCVGSVLVFLRSGNGSHNLTDQVIPSICHSVLSYIIKLYINHLVYTIAC